MEVRPLEEFGYPGYSVREDGKVFDPNGVNVATPKSGPNRRHTAKLIDVHGDTRSVQVHRLVAMAFIPNPEGYTTVQFLDKDPSNLHFMNLEWTGSYDTPKKTAVVHAIKVGFAAEDIMLKYSVSKTYVRSIFKEYEGEINQWRRKNRVPLLGWQRGIVTIDAE